MKKNMLVWILKNGVYLAVFFMSFSVAGLGWYAGFITQTIPKVNVVFLCVVSLLCVLSMFLFVKSSTPEM